MRERPYIGKNIKKTEKSEDVLVYYENRDDGVPKCLCWAEIFIITENNYNKEKNLSNEYSIILESPGDITQKRFPEEEVDTYTLFDNETKKNRTLNFTIVNKTKEFTIKQHKTLHCGAGPILIKTYIEWPKTNRQKIEIRLIPASPSKWQIYKNKSIDYTTLSPSSQTFDTTNTENYSYTNLEDVTLSTLETETFKTTSKRNRTLGKEESGSLDINLGSKSEQYGNGKVSKSKKRKRVNRDRVFKPSNINFKLRDIRAGMKRERLTRNVYFKKLSDCEDIFNTTEPNFFVNPEEYDDILNVFDLICLSNSTSSWILKGNHKFLVNIQISIEHIIIENVKGAEQEKPESVIEWEEQNVYRLNRN